MFGMSCVPALAASLPARLKELVQAQATILRKEKHARESPKHVLFVKNLNAVDRAQFDHSGSLFF